MMVAAGNRARLPPGLARDAAARAVAEDVGRGDLTTGLLIAADRSGRASIVAGQDLVLAGLDVAAAVFAYVDSALQFSPVAADGDRLIAGREAARVVGACAGILTAERVALNFLQRLSGIATLTARAVAAVAGREVQILDTRKTTPGLRLLEKYAVRVGGGVAHRSGLDDGILIKDNHVACYASAAEAVRQARVGAPPLIRVEVEIDRLADLEPVIAAGAEVVLLDNFTPSEAGEAARRAAGRVILEVSGGITLETLPDYARSGVHRISIGQLTHSAPAADLSLRLIPGEEEDDA